MTEIGDGAARSFDLGTRWILALDFSHDGGTLMAGVQGGDLEFWKLEDVRRDNGRVRPIAWSEHRADVTAAAYAPDGSAIVSGARDHSLILWHPDPPSRFVSELARVAETSVADVDPNTMRMAIGTKTGDVLRSPVAPGSKGAAVPLLNIGEAVTAVALGADGEVFAGTRDGEVVGIDGQSAQRRFSTGQRRPIVRIRFSPDQLRVAAATDNGSSRCGTWSLARNSPPSQETARATHARAALHPGWILASSPMVFAWSPFTAISGRSSGTGARGRHASPLPFRPTSYFTSAAFAADGRTIALGTGLYEGEVLLLDHMNPDAPVGRLPAHSLQDVTALAFSPDGRLLVSGGFDARIGVWDVAGRRRLGNVHETAGGVTSIAYASHGLTVTAMTSLGAVLRWDLDPSNWVEIACGIANRELTAEERRRFMDGGGWDVCF